MVDYLAWAKADPLTVEQAAQLWAEVDPSTPSFMWTPAQTAEIGARLQMLCGRIATRELQADHRGNGLEFIGRYERSLIFRSELTALATRLGERPRFLLADEAVAARPEEGESLSSGKETSTPEQAPAPTSLSSAGVDKAFVSSLFGPERTKAPDSSPPPLRVVPGARRISNAPPPPHYVRGTIGPLPARAAEISPARATSSPLSPDVNHRRPAGRRARQREQVSQWIADKYPDGPPASITTDALVAELKEDGIAVSARTVSRAMGRK